MRNPTITSVVCAAIGLVAISCIAQATDEELNEMCDNLVELRGELAPPSVETIASDISMKFDEEANRIVSEQTRQQQILNEAMQARLTSAESDVEKDEIKREYQEKIAELSASHAPKIAEVNAKKSESLKSAQKEAAENEMAWNEAVSECVASSKKEGVSQEVARCRIQAQTTDKYWNGCR